MHIGKNHALCCKRIHMRGSNLPLWVKAFHIAIAKIIAKHINDVGLAYNLCCRKISKNHHHQRNAFKNMLHFYSLLINFKKR